VVERQRSAAPVEGRPEDALDGRGGVVLEVILGDQEGAASARWASVAVSAPRNFEGGVAAGGARTGRGSGWQRRRLGEWGVREPPLVTRGRTGPSWRETVVGACDAGSSQSSSARGEPRAGADIAGSAGRPRATSRQGVVVQLRVLPALRDVRAGAAGHRLHQRIRHTLRAARCSPERGAQGADATVELVHESLVERWPTLVRCSTTTRTTLRCSTRARDATRMAAMRALSGDPTTQLALLREILGATVAGGPRSRAYKGAPRSRARSG